MRLKTDQTRRLKRQKSSLGSLRFLPVTPDSRESSIVTNNESEYKLKDSLVATAASCRSFQKMESFEGSFHRSIANSSPVSSSRSDFQDERKNESGHQDVQMSTPEIGSRLQTIESFEGSFDEISTATDKQYGFNNSISQVQRSYTPYESEDRSCEEIFDDDSIIPSKPGELFEC